MSFADYGPDMIADAAAAEDIEAAAKRIRKGKARAERTVYCPVCGAPAGAPCADPGVVAATELVADGVAHTARLDAAGVPR